MINTDKIIGFYTEVFGNEIDEYEQVEKYTVCYEGHIFEDDTDGYNTHGCETWEDAKAIYDVYPDVSIRDNEYGVTFSNGDWS